MLYEKCRKMLTVDINMEIHQLDTIRRVLSLVDEECKKLTLLDIERLWNSYKEWHDKDIPVDKDWLKRYVRWIAKDFVTNEEMRNIYACVDEIFDVK